nr:Arc family DNA-binding protein [Burkholderia gladioli]
MSEPTQPPSRTADQFVVRLPDGMRDQIAEAAKTNNRSMNAEIVSRLADSFLQEQREKFGRPYQPAAPAINVTLDSRGYPISWDEINEHLAAIRKTGKFNVVSMNTSVITPELVSSSEREQESGDLADFYASKRPKRIRRSKPEDPSS